MNKNLEFYTKRYPAFLDNKECKKAVKELKNKKWQQHTFYNPHTKESTTQSGEKELDVTHQQPSNHEYFMKRFWEVLHEYVVNDIKFDWWKSWRGYTNIRYNMYKKTRLMAEHCDHIHSIFGRGDEPTGIPILSVLAAFNEEYEGGQFIMWKDTEIEMKTGDIIVFPSNFLFPHRVEPVTKGTRFSGISWTW